MGNFKFHQNFDAVPTLNGRMANAGQLNPELFKFEKGLNFKL